MRTFLWKLMKNLGIFFSLWKDPSDDYAEYKIVGPIFRMVVPGHTNIIEKGSTLFEDII